MILDDINNVVSFFQKRTDRNRTKEAYRSAARRFCEYLDNKKLTHIQVQEFTKLHAITYQDWWVERGSSNTTINNMVGHVRTFFEYFKEREVIATNPFEFVKRLKESESVSHTIFSTEMAERIWNYMYNHSEYKKMYYFTKLIYYTFMRPKEILGLKISNYNFEKRIISIHSTTSKVKISDYVVIPKPLKPILDELEMHKTDSNLLLFSKKLEPGKVIWARNRVSEMHRKVLNELEIPNCYDLYSWKHTGACKAYLSGLGVKEIQRQMRHSDSKMTDTYLRSLGLMINETIKDAVW